MFRHLLTLAFFFMLLKVEAQTCNIISADIVCKEELMSFDVNSSSTITSVKWEMGDATTSTQKSLNHKYSTAGVKAVKVTVTVSGGGTATATKNITVYELPQFKINLKADNIYCLSQNRVCFIDSSIGGDVGVNIKKRIVLWDDGDQSVTNNPAKGSVICHTYANTGTFKVIIELTNDKDCKVKKEFQIKILPDVVPFFKLSGGMGCDSAEVIFEDITQKDTNEIVSRIYTWGDGKKTSTKGRKVSHFYKPGGSYKVSLTLVQKNGCMTKRDSIIDVFIPEIKFDITKDGYKKCYGRNFHLEQRGSLIGAIYLWNVGGKEYDGPTIDISPDLGKHKISLSITYAGCTKTFKYDSIEVVGIIPEIKVLNHNQCQNKDTVYFCEKDRRYGTKNVTFLWDFDDDSASKCTTSIKKGINVKSNCNFSTDSVAKHKYVNGKCRNWKLTIKDLDNGCDAGGDGIINTIKPDTFTLGFSANRKCLGLKPEYKINFNSTLCSAIDVKINLDSICDKKAFIPMPSGAFYQKTCNPNGWVTVGFAIKYGNKKVYRTWCDTSDYFIDPSRECHDTIWFHNWYRLLPEPFPPFEVYGKCIPSKVKPVLLEANQKFISFVVWNWDDKSKADTLIIPPGDSILPTPEHIYKKAGAYTVKYQIENENRCYGLYSQILILGFSMNMKFDTIICPGIKVNFRDSIHYLYSTAPYWHDPARKAKGKESFKWDFDDGRGFVTDTINPVYRFAKQGIFRVRLAAKDSSDCYDTLTKNIRVGGVYAGIKAINKKIICDDIIQFFDSSYSDFVPPADSIVKHFWEFGDFRNPSFLKDPYHFYKSYGQFTIFHKVENTRGCKDSASITIKIDGPEPKFEIITDTVGCVPFRAEFKNTSKKTRDFIWYFGDPLKSKLSTNKDTNVSFTYLQPGTYYIYLYGSDSVINPNADSAIYYCKSTFPDTSQLNHAVRRIVVLPIPKVDFNFDSMQCKGKPFTVTDNSDPIYKRYKWTIPGVDSIETVNKTATLKSKDTGSFYIKYTPWYTPSGPYQRYCYDTIRKLVHITNIDAKFDFVKDDNCPIYTFTNRSKDYKSIKWDLGHAAAGEDQNIRYDEVVTHNYVPDKGTFYPCLIVESNYGCRDTLYTEFVVNFDLKMNIPNVFTPDNNDNLNDAFDIDMINMEEYELSIYNRWGQVVFRSNYDGVRNDGVNWTGKTKSGTDCPEGTYFYIFKYKFKCQETKNRTNGIITLIRSKD
jgi:gliding motility-associated-like protein